MPQRFFAGRRILRLGFLLGAAAGAAAAQQTPLPQVPFVYKSNVDEVLLHATVLDHKHAAVDNLAQSQFAVYENGVAQKLLYFTHEDAPVSIGLVIDNSGSMREKRPEVAQAALNLVRSGNPEDETFVVNFSDESYIDSEFTNDPDKLQNALQQIDSRGGTALYDAIIASLDYLNEYAKHDKKALLVVTDGFDDASRYTLEQAVRAVQAPNGPLIYCIGLEDQDDTHSMHVHSERVLKSFSDATGGLAFFPKNVADVDAITKQVAEDIRSQYTLAYHSSLRGEGYRTIKVEVTGPHEKNLSIRTRAGYYLPAPAAASSDGH